MDTERSPTPTGALACLALVMLLSSLGTSIANVALPTYIQAFGASFQAVQWVVLAYLLAVTALVVTAGRLGDLFGRRRLMLAGITLFTAASLACAAAPSLWVLVAARVGQGAGAALMMALTLALVGEAVPKERAGRAMGLLGTTSAVGTALGPSLGGVLIATAGWPSIFLVNLPLGVLAAVLAWRFLPRARDTASGNAVRGRFDLRGSLLLMAALIAYALAMTLGRGHFGAINLALAATAAAATALFLRVEEKAASPLVRPALFRDRVVGAGFAASALATTVAMATLVVGPFYLSGALHLDAAKVGLAMSAGPLVAALAGVPAGKAVDRFGAPRMAIAGLVLMAIGALLLARIASASGVAGYVAALATLTAGFATFQAANNTAVVTGVDAGQRGVVSGLLNLSRNLGLVTGASLMGAVFFAGARTRTIATASEVAVAAGTHAAFLVATLLVGLALLVVVVAAPRSATGTAFFRRRGRA
jgi:EmrB/QacA subfamily drug resistance transporter